jgi:hypothetical protein
MVCKVRRFKEWNVTMSEIQSFRTKTLELSGVYPIIGERLIHGSDISGKFHIELEKLIDESADLSDFNSRLKEFVELWKITPA